MGALDQWQRCEAQAWLRLPRKVLISATLLPFTEHTAAFHQRSVDQYMQHACRSCCMRHHEFCSTSNLWLGLAPQISATPQVVPDGSMMVVERVVVGIDDPQADGEFEQMEPGYKIRRPQLLKRLRSQTSALDSSGPLLIFSAESLKKPSIGAWILGSDLEDASTW